MFLQEGATKADVDQVLIRADINILLLQLATFCRENVECILVIFCRVGTPTQLVNIDIICLVRDNYC